MKENGIAKQIVDAAFQVHQKLGPGLLESVYETVLGHELEKRGYSMIKSSRLCVRHNLSSSFIDNRYI